VRGVADPNLSLMAWRSAIIANSLLGRQVYDVGGESSVFDFDKIP
jgi:lysine N6-hydroxylase